MTTEAPNDPKPIEPISADEFFTTLEAKFWVAPGKTLLGEIAFSQEESDKLASIIQKLVTRDGADRVTQWLIDNCPYILAIWLVNEAFFHFASGAYWRTVLARIGIDDVQAYSTRLGRAFVNFLERRRLPRFRRLNTQWRYLGPILAHAGIPRSCLPEFFEKVLPCAEECAAAEDEAGFEQLLASLPRLYLTNPTKWFLTFGEQIARDFLKRAVELRRFWFANRTLPEPKVTGLPMRVVEAFKQWTEREQPPRAAIRTRRSLRRPVLRLDPMHGLTLGLPSQRLEPGESLLRWIVEPDTVTSTCVESRSEPGERVTSADQLSLAEPFGSRKVRLLSGDFELGTWVFEGISRNKPVFFFAAEDLRVISSRMVESGLIGIAHVSEWRLIGYGESEDVVPRVVESLGVMPFGWHELEAKIYDLTDLERIELRSPDDQTSVQIQLVAVEAFRPRLRDSAGRADSARDVDAVFLGSAPWLEIWKAPHQSKAEFLNSWTLELRSAAVEGKPVKHVVRVRDLQKEPENVYLLGALAEQAEDLE